MQGAAGLTCLLVYVARFVVNAVSLSLLSDVNHLVGYDANHPFEHVEGSACCLESSMEVDDVENCKQHCLQTEGCGSFLFASSEGQCYLISQESNFQPVDNPDSCKRRCVEQEACHAFVFTPSNHLCFLVRFTGQTHNGTADAASVQRAEDRIFGLVRDFPTGSIQAAISSSVLRASATDSRVSGSITNMLGSASIAAEPHSISVGVAAGPQSTTTVGTRRHDRWGQTILHGQLGSVLVGIVCVAFSMVLGLLGRAAFATSALRLLAPPSPKPQGSDVTRGKHTNSLVVAISVPTAMDSLQLLPAPVNATNIEQCNADSREGAHFPPATVKCVAECWPLTPPPSRETASSEESSPPPVVAAKMSMFMNSKIREDISPPKVAAVKLTRLSGDVFSTPCKATMDWRQREMLVPERRSVDFAGPTNYPVPGEASPHARSMSRKLSLREVVEHKSSGEESVSMMPTPACDSENHDPADAINKEPDAISVGGPEVGLSLATLLLGVLTLERKTMAVTMLVLLCIGTALGIKLIKALSATGVDESPWSSQISSWPEEEIRDICDVQR